MFQTESGFFPTRVQPPECTLRTLLKQRILPWIPGPPLIHQAAVEADLNFYDLSKVYDRDEYIYIDWVHVSPNGNEYMADALATIVSRESLR